MKDLKLIIGFFTLVFLLFTGHSIPEKQLSDCASELPADCGITKGQLNLRFLNRTNYDLNNIKVESVKFGTLNNGNQSCFISLSPENKRPILSFCIKGRNFETHLPVMLEEEGVFAYRIEIESFQKRRVRLSKIQEI